MEIPVKALKNFTSARYGNVETGEQFNCDSAIAKQWQSNGMVEIMEATYNTKVVRETPKETGALRNIPLGSGSDKESSSSQAAPASPKRTAKKSGAKKPSASTRQSS